MKNVIVTGGCGFIGSHLAELLAIKGFNVFVIDNLFSGKKTNIKITKNITIIKEDILNRKKILSKIKNKKIHAIFHLAAMADIVPSIIDPIKYMNTNVMGTTKILEIARMKKVKNLSILLPHLVMEFQKNILLRKVQKLNANIPMH